MNDINRRGFLGTLIASVAALFGKRAEASANDLDQRAQSRYVPAAKFRDGDLVWHVGLLIYGVVTDTALVIDGQRWVGVNWCNGQTTYSTSEVEDRLEGCMFVGQAFNVDKIDPGGYLHFAEGFCLCKPTQSVKAGQCVIWNKPISPVIHGRMPQRIEPFIKEWADKILECASKVGYDPHFRVLGFATNDVTVPSGSLISGQTARWEEYSWCWVVPQMEKPEAWDAAETYWYKNQQELGL